jgi:uncharacterized protein (DUF1697 family)
MIAGAIVLWDREVVRQLAVVGAQVAIVAGKWVSGIRKVAKMQRYVAFLRGMNLGARRIKNDELRQRFEELGMGEVSCFRASGNVLFASEEHDGEGLRERLETGLAESLGYYVPIFLRNAAELKAVSALEPFGSALVSASKGKLQIAFLSAEPEPKARKQALALSSAADPLAVKARQLYWLPSGGISESDLDLKALESILGQWTMRTKGTVDQIAARLD